MIGLEVRERRGAPSEREGHGGLHPLEELLARKMLHGMFSQPTVMARNGQDHQRDGEHEGRLVGLVVVAVARRAASWRRRAASWAAGAAIVDGGPPVANATAPWPVPRGQLGDLGVDVLADRLVAELADIGLVVATPVLAEEREPDAAGHVGRGQERADEPDDHERGVAVARRRWR